MKLFYTRRSGGHSDRYPATVLAMNFNMEVDDDAVERELEADMASTGELYGEKYLGNTRTKEVHDLDLETENCQIDQIIEAGHATPFDTLKEAHQEGYDNCAFCLGSSER